MGNEFISLFSEINCNTTQQMAWIEGRVTTLCINTIYYIGIFEWYFNSILEQDGALINIYSNINFSSFMKTIEWQALNIFLVRSTDV